jgi:hypothetical protein
MLATIHSVHIFIYSLFLKQGSNRTTLRSHCFVGVGNLISHSERYTQMEHVCLKRKEYLNLKGSSRRMEQIAQRETSKYATSRQTGHSTHSEKKVKGKGVPVHAIKPYRRSRGTAPRIPLEVGEWSTSRSVRIIPRKEPRTKQNAFRK